MNAFTIQLGRLTEGNEQKLETLKLAVEAKLKAIQDDNTKQLDGMRAVVEEKLQGTLEKRLANTVDEAARRTRAIGRKLRTVEGLPATEANTVLALNGPTATIIEEEEPECTD